LPHKKQFIIPELAAKTGGIRQIEMAGKYSPPIADFFIRNEN